MHVSRTLLDREIFRAALTILCLALLIPWGPAIKAQASSQTPQTQGNQGYAQNSWGLGVVVPEGSTLYGGQSVDWAHVSNVTAIVQIPTISNTTAPVYAVLSLMTKDGTVLQAAFGIYPRNASWLVYAMFIANINQSPQHYVWVTNASGPSAEPGNVVSISIYQTEGIWGFKVSNLNDSLTSQQSLGASTKESPEIGDQEVFALESYSSDTSTFQNMGNMTLKSLYVNEKRLVSGWYLYSDWDPLHNPLFVVGGAPSLPPVDASILDNGRVVWFYSESWYGNSQIDETLPVAVAILILLGAALSGVLLSMRYIKRAAVRTVESPDRRG